VVIQLSGFAYGSARHASLCSRLDPLKPHPKCRLDPWGLAPISCFASACTLDLCSAQQASLHMKFSAFVDYIYNYTSDFTNEKLRS